MGEGPGVIQEASPTRGSGVRFSIGSSKPERQLTLARSIRTHRLDEKNRPQHATGLESLKRFQRSVSWSRRAFVPFDHPGPSENGLEISSCHIVPYSS